MASLLLLVVKDKNMRIVHPLFLPASLGNGQEKRITCYVLTEEFTLETGSDLLLYKKAEDIFHFQFPGFLILFLI